MLLGENRPAAGGASGFNPHPAVRPGAASMGNWLQAPGPRCFNPHPAVRPGAAWTSYSTILTTTRCFNPHPAVRPGAAHHQRPRQGAEGVSILTRPLGRVLPPRPPSRLPFCGFQSSPGLTAGCCNVWGVNSLQARCFNPHPAVRPGAAPRHRFWPRPVCRFNPHPAVRPGAAPSADKMLTNRTMFQSSPGR